MPRLSVINAIKIDNWNESADESTVRAAYRVGKVVMVSGTPTFQAIDDAIETTVTVPINDGMLRPEVRDAIITAAFLQESLDISADHLFLLNGTMAF